jgi:hypothetical protein
MEKAGVRVSITRLYNHQVRIYRKLPLLESRGPLGSTSKTPVAVTAIPPRFNALADMNWGGALTDKGPGEMQGGKRRWFLDKALDVRERDILSVTSGPEAGQTLEVESVAKPANPRRHHHTEVIVDTWTGSLTDD